MTDLRAETAMPGTSLFTTASGHLRIAAGVTAAMITLARNVPISTTDSGVTHPWLHSSHERSAVSRRAKRLPTLLSVIAGVVDLFGFLGLGAIFTAHITGNPVAIAALLVRGEPLNLARLPTLPAYMLAVAAALLAEVHRAGIVPRWRGYFSE